MLQAEEEDGVPQPLSALCSRRRTTTCSEVRVQVHSYAGNEEDEHAHEESATRKVLLTGFSLLIGAFASAHCRVHREELYASGRNTHQLRVTKGDVTLTGLPDEFRRMASYKDRVEAYKESDAFIILAYNGPSSLGIVQREYDNIVAYSQRANPIVTVVGSWHHRTKKPGERRKKAKPFSKMALLAEKLHAKYDVINTSTFDVSNDEDIEVVDKVIDELGARLRSPSLDMATSSATPGGERLLTRSKWQKFVAFFGKSPGTVRVAS